MPKPTRRANTRTRSDNIVRLFPERELLKMGAGPDPDSSRRDDPAYRAARKHYAAYLFTGAHDHPVASKLLDELLETPPTTKAGARYVLEYLMGLTGGVGKLLTANYTQTLLRSPVLAD